MVSVFGMEKRWWESGPTDVLGRISPHCMSSELTKSTGDKGCLRGYQCGVGRLQWCTSLELRFLGPHFLIIGIEISADLKFSKRTIEVGCINIEPHDFPGCPQLNDAPIQSMPSLNANQILTHQSKFELCLRLSQPLNKAPLGPNWPFMLGAG